MMQSEPRIVTARPLFGDTWPDPPSARAVDSDDGRYLEDDPRPELSEAQKAKRRGLASVVRCAEKMDDAAVELGEWLDERDDHAHDDDLAIVRKWLARLIEHYGDAATGRLG
jgi:hypothetical protein